MKLLQGEEDTGDHRRETDVLDAKLRDTGRSRQIFRALIQNILITSFKVQSWKTTRCCQRCLVPEISFRNSPISACGSFQAVQHC